MTTWKRLERVGRDIDAVTYWRDRSAAYGAEFGGSYHGHRLGVIRRVLDALDVDGRLCVDVGCGDGVHVEELALRGARVVGFDPVEELLTLAAARLDGTNLDARVERGGVEALESLADASVSVLLAINVLHYFTDDQEARFYREARRVLAPGGSLVVVHSNELFDLYTLNRFTVEFHARHFGSDPDSVASLLTRAGEPERPTYNVRENPLTYGHKLDALGFDEVQQEFINLHPVQPLLMDAAVHRDVNRREYGDTLDWSCEERWKLMFRCSLFVSRAVRR